MRVIIQLPEDVELDPVELQFFFAAHLFDAGLLSSGQAAKVAGIGRRQFLETVGKYGISIFQYTPEELLEDLKNL